MEKNKILDLIYIAVDEVNEQLPKNKQLAKSPDTKLFGKDGKLDSLALVNFIVAVEDIIDDETDISLTIADEKAMSQSNSPFQSIDRLADYITQLIREENG